MEFAPNSKNKALLGSLAFVSTALGLFFGFLAVFICNFYFLKTNWAWRVPFLLSFPIGIIGFYIRNKLEESAEFKNLKSKNLLSKAPLFELIKDHKKNFLLICSIFISISILFYVFFGFLTTFLVKVLGYDQLQVSLIYLVCTIALGGFSIISGIISDRFGVYKVLLVGMLVFVALLFPAFYLILSKNFIATFCGCLMFILLAAMYQGSIPSIIVKIFPTRVRAIGTALSFNLVSVIFGGLAPLTLTWLVKIANSYYVIPCYLIGFSFLALIGLLLGKKVIS